MGQITLAGEVDQYTFTVRASRSTWSCYASLIDGNLEDDTPN